MQNFIQKFGKSSLGFEKPVFLFEKLKTLTSSNYFRVQYFLLKLADVSYLPQCLHKGVGIISILFRSWVIYKNQKDLVSTQSFFTFLSITQDPNKMKKSRTPVCSHD